MRRSSTYVDDFRDHVGGRPALSALTGAISIAILSCSRRMQVQMAEEVILNKRYRLLTEIGAGEMAVVFRGEDTWQGVPVAVKVLRRAYVEDEAFLARFHSQAQAVASLLHPHIVATYEVGQEGDCP